MKKKFAGLAMFTVLIASLASGCIVRERYSNHPYHHYDRYDHDDHRDLDDHRDHDDRYDRH
jgi:hypothetical protein